MGLYTIVDTIFVSRFVDTNALSAINLVCPIINIIVGLGTRLATGGSAIVACKMGNGYGWSKENFYFDYIICRYNWNTNYQYRFTSSMFTALSNGKISAILSFLRTFGFIAIGLLTLPNILNIDGIWLAVPIAELLTLFLTVSFIYRYKNKYNYI
ncbi:hypothetical protein [Clostridioides sp. ES-S-0048-02]|uniref:hypothetical protein n=1 Tax=Clostridioides sp. ES-S-0048-02 TaxID=2770777 RepID=UPI001D12CD0A|nr:hypothetical protein [Clostridioides sp. ES-S-0048-02]